MKETDRQTGGSPGKTPTETGRREVGRMEGGSSSMGEVAEGKKGGVVRVREKAVSPCSAVWSL